MATVDIGVCFEYQGDDKPASFYFLDSQCKATTFFLATKSPATFTLKKGASMCPQVSPCGAEFEFRSVSLSPKGKAGFSVTAEMLENGDFPLPAFDGLQVTFTQFDTDTISFSVAFDTRTLLEMVVTVADASGVVGLPLFSSKDPQIVLDRDP